MKKIFTTITFSILILNSYAQITCDSSGNVVLYSNYDGGVLNINVDVNIPNLKIGIVSYEMVTINLAGPYVNNISRIEFAGYTTTTHHHCGNSPTITSINGAPAGTDTLVFMPTSPVSNSNGYYIIICNYSCDTSSNQGGCNTPDQIAAYFQQEFGGLLRYHFTQYGCWNGTYNISDGGNCCISAFTPPPAALFSSQNHICPGTCTDFTNLSSNATSYQWTFAGGNPSSSADVSPTSVCYNTPGSYAVSLVATGPGGSDTITLNNYITVYPYPAPQGILQSGDTLFANPGAMSYQWYYDTAAIAGATNYFWVAQLDGNYSVVATDDNGCEAEAVIFNVVTASLNEQLAIGSWQLAIIPNPVKDEFTIGSPNGAEGHNARFTMEAADVRIYDLVGKKILNTQFRNAGSESTPVDVHSLPPGMYYVELSDGKNFLRAKFVKQ